MSTLVELMKITGLMWKCSWKILAILTLKTAFIE